MSTTDLKEMIKVKIDALEDVQLLDLVNTLISTSQNNNTLQAEMYFDKMSERYNGVLKKLAQ